MAHGHPDYGQDTQKQTIHVVTDLGELAARINPLNVFDRRGDMVFWDGFESGMGNWEVSGGGLGYAVTETPYTSRAGGWSAKLTTGSTLTKMVKIRKYIGFPVLGAFGMEFSFTLQANLNYLRIQLEADNLIENKLLSVQYEVDTDELKVYIGGLGYTVIDSALNLRAYDQQFHTLKIVGDLSSQYYKRLMLNQTEYDLSSYPIGITATAALNYLSAELTVVSDAANRDIYVDSCIITQNEP